MCVAASPTHAIQTAAGREGEEGLQSEEGCSQGRGGLQQAAVINGLAGAAD